VPCETPLGLRGSVSEGEKQGQSEELGKKQNDKDQNRELEAFSRGN
jgi:hypothetical protein